MKAARWVSAALFATCLLAPTACAAQTDPIAAIDARLGRLEAGGEFMGTVLVARGADVIYERGFGSADREAELPNTVDTPYNICSMGKTITAAAAMLLVEDGLIELERRVADYLPDFDAQGRGPITVHNLLSHTSGLGNYMARREFDRDMDSFVAIDQVYELVKLESPEFEPGERFRYANSGYITLGRLIEEVTGGTYYDFVRARILVPLGMDDTNFWLTSERPGDAARGYVRTDAGEFVRERYEAPNPYSDGGVHSTVGDLFSFDQALHAGELVSPESRDRMFTPNLNGYGYGLSIKPPEEHSSNQTSIGHTGGLRDRSTVLRHFVDSDVTIIVLSNMPAMAFEVAREIEAMLFR